MTDVNKNRSCLDYSTRTISELEIEIARLKAELAASEQLRIREYEATAYVQSLLDDIKDKEAAELKRKQDLEDQKREDKIKADIRKAEEELKRRKDAYDEAERVRKDKFNTQLVITIGGIISGLITLYGILK